MIFFSTPLGVSKFRPLKGSEQTTSLLVVLILTQVKKSVALIDDAFYNPQLGGCQFPHLFRQ